MEYLFTKNGAPLTVAGADIFDRAGRQVARHFDGTLYACDGRYAGSIVNDRVVYRAASANTTISSFAPQIFAPSSMANRRPIALRGEEPFVQAAPGRRAAAAPHQPVRIGWDDRFEDIVSRLRILDIWAPEIL